MLTCKKTRWLLLPRQHTGSMPKGQAFNVMQKKFRKCFPQQRPQRRENESTTTFHAKSNDQKFDGVACAGVCVRGEGVGRWRELSKKRLPFSLFFFFFFSFKVSSLARLAFFSNLSVLCVSLSCAKCPSSLQSVSPPSFGSS